MSLLDDLISALPGDAPAREVRVGAFWTAVWSRSCGLASTLGAGDHEHGATFVAEAGRLQERSARRLAGLAHSDSTLEAGIGLAAINSLLEVDEMRCVELNAGQFLIERAPGKRVALVGHFPFVPQLRRAAQRLWVIDLHPGAGDLRPEQGAGLIPEADLVAITGSALINHTLEGLLGRCRRDSLVMVLGPTAPLSPVLFDYGVDVISGTRVVDPERALRSVTQGAVFRQVEGVRLLSMNRREGFDEPGRTIVR
jgi:uncharacterized protein (DUF4213/DUF364 family)